MGIPWTTLPSPHRFHCVLNVINCRDVCTGQRSSSLFLLPQSQKALTLCGEPHTFPGTLSWPGSDFWLRSADGEGATYVKDAQQHCLQHQGLELQVPGNLCQFCESNWNSLWFHRFFYESEDTAAKAPECQSTNYPATERAASLSFPVNNLIRNWVLMLLVGYTGGRGKESLKTKCIYVQWKY